MSYNPDIHHCRSIRLRHYDYAAAGYYFVTICVQGRENLFGDVADGTMQPNEAGRMVEAVWMEISQRFPNVLIDEFTVMPNHFHGILVLNPPEPNHPYVGKDNSGI
jgi:REP element-mobilizing transposase RayT